MLDHFQLNAKKPSSKCCLCFHNSRFSDWFLTCHYHVGTMPFVVVYTLVSRYQLLYVMQTWEQPNLVKGWFEKQY